MNQRIKVFLMVLLILSGTVCSAQHIHDEASLLAAVTAANRDTAVTRLFFARDAVINISRTIEYNGSQDITIIGNNARIDGSAAGILRFDAQTLEASTTDASLLFNTSANITIRNLTLENNNTRGIAVNIPDTATGAETLITLEHVKIANSASHGLHINDNTRLSARGSLGSVTSIRLDIRDCLFTGNGIAGIDLDGIRVDEAGAGSIDAVIVDTRIFGNGGDGLELDESGPGDVRVRLVNVSLNDNGFYSPQGYDDGFDIDERGSGGIEAYLSDVRLNNNMDEGLDLDELGDGDIKVKLMSVTALNNNNEALKLDEENQGNIYANLNNIEITGNGDDGIQITELGKGKVKSVLNSINCSNNKKYGIKIEQWLIEDEPFLMEEPGTISSAQISLNDNGTGQDILVHNIVRD